MLVVMQSHSTTEQIDRVLDAIREMGLTPHPMPGPTRTAIGITGNTGLIDSRPLEVLPGVFELIRVTKPYKLASREMHGHDTVVRLPQGTFGGGPFAIIAGPCSVEDESLILRTADWLMARGVRFLLRRGVQAEDQPVRLPGARAGGPGHLPRQGEDGHRHRHRADGHRERRRRRGGRRHHPGRRAQHAELQPAEAALAAGKPVLLERGLSATLEEWLMSAEYLLSGGNYDVILCERGVRTFSDHSRNTLDLSVIPPAKALSHLPILVDPSHGTGLRDFVPPMALAALAAGADGLLIEVHPDPDLRALRRRPDARLRPVRPAARPAQVTGRAPGPDPLIRRESDFARQSLMRRPRRPSRPVAAQDEEGHADRAADHHPRIGRSLYFRTASPSPNIGRASTMIGCRK